MFKSLTKLCGSNNKKSSCLTSSWDALTETPSNLSSLTSVLETHPYTSAKSDLRNVNGKKTLIGALEDTCKRNWNQNSISLLPKDFKKMPVHDFMSYKELLITTRYLSWGMNRSFKFKKKKVVFGTFSSNPLIHIITTFACLYNNFEVNIIPSNASISEFSRIAKANCITHLLCSTDNLSILKKRIKSVVVACPKLATIIVPPKTTLKEIDVGFFRKNNLQIFPYQALLTMGKLGVVDMLKPDLDENDDFEVETPISQKMNGKINKDEEYHERIKIHQISEVTDKTDKTNKITEKKRKIKSILYTSENLLTAINVTICGLKLSKRDRCLLYVPTHTTFGFTTLCSLLFSGSEIIYGTSSLLQCTGLHQIQNIIKPTLFIALPFIYEYIKLTMFSLHPLLSLVKFGKYFNDSLKRKRELINGNKNPFHVFGIKLRAAIAPISRLNDQILYNRLHKFYKFILGKRKFINALIANEVTGIATLQVPLNTSMIGKVMSLKRSIKCEGHICNVIGSIGFGIFNAMRYKIVPLLDKKDDLCIINNPREGELYIRGDNVIKNYHRDLLESKRRFTKDGWFKSGIIVEKMPDGSFHYVSKIKCEDMKIDVSKMEKMEEYYSNVSFIKSGGLNLYTSHCEKKIVAVVKVDIDFVKRLHSNRMEMVNLSLREVRELLDQSFEGIHNQWSLNGDEKICDVVLCEEEKNKKKEFRYGDRFKTYEELKESIENTFEKLDKES